MRETAAPPPAPTPAPMPNVPPPAAMPGAPGAVVIDGKPLNKSDVVVFLHLGHSNMAGRTSTPPELRSINFESHPRLWAYAKGGAFRPAKEPLSGDYLTKNGAGPGMSILRTALALAPERTFVSIGRGHDGSIGGHCRNFRKGALLYDFVMGPAMELKDRVTFGGIFVMLGVNEFRRDPRNLPRFHECLEGIAADMRGDLGDPNIPFLLGDWELGATGAFDPMNDYAVTTREQMRIAIANIPRAVLIPSDMLPMSDDHHYDLAGYKLWAERGFAVLKEKGWIPWAP
jgi:Carbohydrate esterase, sialic acid-specific acetylesterase